MSKTSLVPRAGRCGSLCLTLVGLIALFACGSPESAVEQAPNAAALEPVVAHPALEGLEEQIAGSLGDWRMPGLAVAVTVGPDLVFAEGFGIKEIGREERIDAETLFQIGSVSKSFGASAIGVLVDDGLVTFDDSVVQHLPWLELKDRELTQKITLRDLLCHRTGIAEDTYPALGILDGRAVAERARHLENAAEYGAHRYSNLGYGLLGLVVEEVTGTSWTSFMQERVFTPLGMAASAATPYGVWDAPFVAPAFLGSAPAGVPSIDDAPGKNVAMPHGVDRNGARRVLPWQSYDNMQAAGSVVSSVRDMSRWLRLHLGLAEEAGVLSGTTLRALHEAQVEAPAAWTFFEADVDGTPPSYAMGWMRGSFAGHTVISHGGGIFGFPAYAAFLPDLEVGVVVLANGSTWTPYYPHQEITATVFGRMLGVEDRDWHAETMEATAAIQAMVDQALAGIDAQRDESATPSRPLADLVGSYSAEHAGSLGVSLPEGSHLRLAFEGEGAFSGELVPWNGDTFRLYFDGGDGQAYGSALVTFQPEGDGRAMALDMGRFGKYLRQD